MVLMHAVLKLSNYYLQKLQKSLLQNIFVYKQRELDPGFLRYWFSKSNFQLLLLNFWSPNNATSSFNYTLKVDKGLFSFNYLKSLQLLYLNLQSRNKIMEHILNYWSTFMTQLNWQSRHFAPQDRLSLRRLQHSFGCCWHAQLSKFAVLVRCIGYTQARDAVVPTASARRVLVWGLSIVLSSANVADPSELTNTAD